MHGQAVQVVLGIHHVPQRYEYMLYNMLQGLFLHSLPVEIVPVEIVPVEMVAASVSPVA